MDGLYHVMGQMIFFLGYRPFGKKVNDNFKRQMVSKPLGSKFKEHSLKINCQVYPEQSILSFTEVHASKIYISYSQHSGSIRMDVCAAQPYTYTPVGICTIDLFS